MLAGFHTIDEHFLTTPYERILPALIGLLNVWYTDCSATQTVAVLPYVQYLEHLQTFLQQLTMDCNGKHVASTAAVNYADPADLLGRARTNGQHPSTS